MVQHSKKKKKKKSLESLNFWSTWTLERTSHRRSIADCCSVFLIRLMLKKLNYENFKVGSITMFMLNFPLMIRYISTRCVLTEKFINGNKTTKARLVAMGFEKEHLAKLCTDSPICGKESLRIVIAIIITNWWEINSLDIKSAFLQWKKISRDLFVKPLKETKTDNLRKLLKTVYGLNDASITWYLPVRDKFIICGACVSKYDEAIYYWHYKNTL